MATPLTKEKAGSCLVTTSDGNLLSIGGYAGGNGTPQKGVHRYKTTDNRWDNLGSNPFNNFVHRGCGTVTNSATGKGRYLYNVRRVVKVPFEMELSSDPVPKSWSNCWNFSVQSSFPTKTIREKLELSSVQVPKFGWNCRN